MEITVFEKLEFGQLSAIEIEGEPWFIAVDVCSILGLSNVTESLKALDDDEKLTSELLRAGQSRKVNLISESGMYALIFRSRKSFAKKFRKWITKDVIPEIRKTGSYSQKEGLMPIEALLNVVQNMVDQQKQLENHGERITDLEKRVEYKDQDRRLLEIENARDWQKEDNKDLYGRK